MTWTIDVRSLAHPFPDGCVVAIGVFDGVHRGHQVLIQQAVDRARKCDLPAVALTFDPHPARVLSPDEAPPLLCTLAHRVERLHALGVDYVVVQPFTPAFATLSAESFIEQVLVRGLGACLVVVGEDFRFGAGRSGDVALLRAHGGFEVLPVPPVLDAWGERIASTRVRQWVQSAELGRVREALGEPFHWEGVVVRGAQRGRTLGYPTANMVPLTTLVCPPSGVYACRVIVDGASYPAAVSVGVPPMFASAQATLEAYLIDFESKSLYGRVLTVEFLERLRDQQVFDTLEALQHQMAHDVQRTEAIYRDFLVTTPS